MADWKEHLLKSGLPLEYEVKQFLATRDYHSRSDFTYLRNDENEILKEFSYDIDCPLAYFENRNYANLMIECKYRHENVKWVFLPETSLARGVIVTPDAFMHPNDYFSDIQFRFSRRNMGSVGTLCSKGIEILPSGCNEQSISHAVNQLAYAFAERVVDGVMHNVESLLGVDHVFFNIPIIVTTANLYRMKENFDIDSIKNATEIDEVADIQDCIVLKVPESLYREKYNLKIFNDFIAQYDRELLNKKLSRGNKDIDFTFSGIAKNHCPETVLVVHHSQGGRELGNVLDYLTKLLDPSPKLLADLEKADEKFNQGMIAAMGLKDDDIA
jgi:hypothetical protein